MRFDWIASRLSDVMSTVSGVAGRSSFALPSAFSSNGGIPIVYKAIVVAVMGIVACGTLVTFSTAKAEEIPAASSGSQIPAASEANPIVEGQPLPPGLDPSLFASSPLLSTIDLSAAAAAGADFGTADDDDSSDDADDKKKNKKAAAANKAANKNKPASANKNNKTAGGESNGGGGNNSKPADQPSESSPPPSEQPAPPTQQPSEPAPSPSTRDPSTCKWWEKSAHKNGC